MSAPGLQQTLSGVLMDAGCSAIADSRSDLTKTPQLVPRNETPRSTERARVNTTAESAVPERYRDCRLKSATTSFAVYADSQIYILDRISNQMMQERLQGARSATADASTQNKWVTTTVVGTATSDRVFTVRSIRK